jgi:hypothetical protein
MKRVNQEIDVRCFVFDHVAYVVKYQICLPIMDYRVDREQSKELANETLRDHAGYL